MSFNSSIEQPNSEPLHADVSKPKVIFLGICLAILTIFDIKLYDASSSVNLVLNPICKTTHLAPMREPYFKSY